MNISFWEFVGTVIIINTIAEGIAKIVQANKE